MLSIFLIPNQCRTSGMRAWNRMSFTPAMSSVALKYLSAESPPRFRRLYTRYLQVIMSSAAERTRGDGDVLGHLAEGTTLLAEVDDETNPSALGTTNALLNGVGEVRFTCADVGAEDVRTVA